MVYTREAAGAKKGRDPWPKDPEEPVAVRVYVPSKVKRLYETEELRGKMSHDVRAALSVRFQNNGYGFDHVRQIFLEAQQRKAESDAQFEIAKDQFFAFVAKEHEQQTKLLDAARAEALIDEMLAGIRERFGLWRKQQAATHTADTVKKRGDRKPSLAWAERELKQSNVLKTRFTKPEELLTFMEET